MCCYYHRSFLVQFCPIVHIHTCPSNIEYMLCIPWAYVACVCLLLFYFSRFGCRNEWASRSGVPSNCVEYYFEQLVFCFHYYLRIKIKCFTLFVCLFAWQTTVTLFWCCCCCCWFVCVCVDHFYQNVCTSRENIDEDIHTFHHLLRDELQTIWILMCDAPTDHLLQCDWRNEKQQPIYTLLVDDRVRQSTNARMLSVEEQWRR